MLGAHPMVTAGGEFELLRRLLDYLGLDWDARVLKFQKTANRVKTPSLWEVRQDLHTRCSDRWRHYETLVRKVQSMSPQDQAHTRLGQKSPSIIKKSTKLL